MRDRRCLNDTKEGTCKNPTTSLELTTSDFGIRIYDATETLDVFSTVCRVPVCCIDSSCRFALGDV